jgi:hypothetical protein
VMQRKLKYVGRFLVHGGAPLLCLHRLREDDL